MLSGMNSVSPSAVQYVGGVMQEELVESRRQQPLERQGSFGLRPAPTTEPGREANGEPDELDKLKSKLMTAWNNVKYGLYLVFEEECVGAALMFIGFRLRFLYYVLVYIPYLLFNLYIHNLLSLVKSVFLWLTCWKQHEKHLKYPNSALSICYYTNFTFKCSSFCRLDCQI